MENESRMHREGVEPTPVVTIDAPTEAQVLESLENKAEVVSELVAGADFSAAIGSAPQEPEGFDSPAFDPVAATMDFAEEPVAPPPEATLERLSELAHEMVALQKEIDEKTVELAERQEALNKISQRTIPDIMAQLQIASFALSDGSKLEVVDKVSASITEANRPAAHAWLREHNFDGIIKTKLTAEFGKGELENAEAAQAKLTELGYDSAIAEAVHPATLTSFVKERLEAGDQIPMSTFGVFERKQTKITVPKKKKQK